MHVQLFRSHGCPALAFQKFPKDAPGIRIVALVIGAQAFQRLAKELGVDVRGRLAGCGDDVVGKKIEKKEKLQAVALCNPAIRL